MIYQKEHQKIKIDSIDPRNLPRENGSTRLQNFYTLPNTPGKNFDIFNVADQISKMTRFFRYCQNMVKKLKIDHLSKPKALTDILITCINIE